MLLSEQPPVESGEIAGVVALIASGFAGQTQSRLRPVYGDELASA